MRKIIFLSILIIALLNCPKRVRGITFIPIKTLEGSASWYSQQDKHIRGTTANMEIFNDTKLTCAMWNVPFGTLLKVTNLENGKAIVVRVNDRGPAKRLVKRGRIVDLTKTAFSRIADTKKGLTQVKVDVLSYPADAPL